MEYKAEKTYIAEKLFKDKSFFYSYFNNSAGAGNMHNHDFYEIFLTTKDGFLHIINGKEYILPKGTLSFIRPGDVHSNRFSDKPQSCVQICFTENVAQDLFSYLDSDYDIDDLTKSTFPPSVQLSEKDFNALFREFRKVETMDLNDRNEINRHCKKLLFSIFTSYFHPYLTKPNNPDIPSWLEKALNISKNKLLYIDGVERVVEASGKSYKTLSRNLKRYYGKTPTEFILDLRLTYAYNLIVTTNLSITDICYECGFNNPSYFYKSFKKKYSETPNKVRSTSKVF